MPRTYVQSNLSPANALSSTWALTWTRLITRDVPNAAGAYPLEGLEDAEWLAWLNITAVSGFYRPHRAALSMLAANPQWLESESTEGYSSSRRNLSDVLSGIVSLTASLEALLPLEHRARITRTTTSIPIEATF